MTRAGNVIANVSSIYSKCATCSELVLEKTKKIDLTEFNFSGLKCAECGKRPLDAVAAHILSLSIQNQHKSDLVLREIGTPLLCPGVSTYHRPHLGDRTLILLTNRSRVADAADRVLDEVREVKAILYGDPTKVAGLTIVEAEPYVYQVLAGCDMRADLVTSAYGQLLIYKSQSKIHIEHDNRTKMLKLGTIPLANRVVFDALAGPGTLGLMSVFMGAEKVILNDAWLPAVENAFLNLYVNKEVLGIRSIKRTSMTEASHDSPELFCTARTSDTDIELYCGRFEKFDVQDSKVDVVLLDPFPGSEIRFESAAKRIRNQNRQMHVVYI